MSVEGHVEEASHVVGLDLEFMWIFCFCDIEKLLGIPESVLKNEVIGMGDNECCLFFVLDDGANQKFEVAFLELNVSDGRFGLVCELMSSR